VQVPSEPFKIASLGAVAECLLGVSVDKLVRYEHDCVVRRDSKRLHLDSIFADRTFASFSCSFFWSCYNTFFICWKLLVGILQSGVGKRFHIGVDVRRIALEDGQDNYAMLGDYCLVFFLFLTVFGGRCLMQYIMQALCGNVFVMCFEFS
jgi:hypothetical protein